MGYPRRVYAEMRCFNTPAAKYFKVGSWQVDWTRQTREVRPKTSKDDIFVDHERWCLRFLFTRSDAVEKHSFPVSRIHCSIAAQKRGHVCKRRGLAIRTKIQNREDPLSEVQDVLRPPCQVLKSYDCTFFPFFFGATLWKSTIIFNKFCGALRWADSTPCGPKRVVGGTSPRIIASLELNRSRTHKEDGHGIADVMKATPRRVHRFLRY